MPSWTACSGRFRARGLFSPLEQTSPGLKHAAQRPFGLTREARGCETQGLLRQRQVEIAKVRGKRLKVLINNLPIPPDDRASQRPSQSPSLDSTNRRTHQRQQGTGGAPFVYTRSY